MAVRTRPFREVLKEARRGRGWSQSQLAREIRVHYRTVQDWEAGTNEPRWSQLVRLCEVFGWPLPFLNVEDEATRV